LRLDVGRVADFLLMKQARADGLAGMLFSDITPQIGSTLNSSQD
jgi:hypothetical protein